MSELPTPGRRRFLRTVGLAGLSTTLPPMLSLAQSPTPGSTPAPGAKPPAGAPATADSSAAKAAPSEDAKALAGIIRRRYGKHLDDGQIEKIAEDFDDDLKALPRLHAVHLANGDEPDFTFRA